MGSRASRIAVPGAGEGQASRARALRGELKTGVVLASRNGYSPDPGQHDIGEPAARELGVRAAQLAQDEHEQLQIAPQADAPRRLLGGRPSAPGLRAVDRV